MKVFHFLILSFVVLGTACGSSGSSDSDSTATETSAEAPLIRQVNEFFGQDGNLWKPAAEEGSSTSGLLVVLISAKHTDKYDTCEIERVDGSVEYLDCNDRVPWSHEPFSCVANSGREHWRSLGTCDQAALVRVVCRNPTEVLTVEGAGAALGAVCERHG